jgi:hypothetical protein
MPSSPKKFSELAAEWKQNWYLNEGDGNYDICADALAQLIREWRATLNPECDAEGSEICHTILGEVKEPDSAKLA